MVKPRYLRVRDNLIGPLACLHYFSVEFLQLRVSLLEFGSQFSHSHRKFQLTSGLLLFQHFFLRHQTFNYSLLVLHSLNKILVYSFCLVLPIFLLFPPANCNPACINPSIVYYSQNRTLKFRKSLLFQNGEYYRYSFPTKQRILFQKTGLHREWLTLFQDV